MAIPARLPRSPRRPRNDDIRVCYLIDVSPEKFMGGGQVHLANLVRQMQNHKSEIINHIFGGPGSHTVIRFLWSIWVIPQVIFYHLFKQKFSLIHAHSIPAIAAGKIISMILAIPIVATIHGNSISDQETPGRTARSLLARFLEEWILTKVKYDAQITVARDFLKVPNVNKNVVYIPNGVDLEVFKGPALGYQGRALSDKIVLFVGRKNDPVKGFKVLEEAMKLVKQEIPDTKLLVADGSISKKEVIKMYSEADLFVLPSLSEGFPLTLLEAWAAKLPVVATAVGEVPHLFGLRSFANFSSEVCETARGYMVKPGNSKSLAQGIIRALENPGLAKLGENGYNLAKRFNWDLVARKTMRVYNVVLVKER